jgi:hypothetical protein
MQDVQSALAISGTAETPEDRSRGDGPGISRIVKQ